MRCALACYVAIAALLACAPPLPPKSVTTRPLRLPSSNPPSAAAALVISIGKAPPSLGSTEEVSAASVTSSSPVTLVLKADLGHPTPHCVGGRHRFARVADFIGVARLPHADRHLPAEVGKQDVVFSSV